MALLLTREPSHMGVQQRRMVVLRRCHQSQELALVAGNAGAAGMADMEPTAPGIGERVHKGEDGGENLA